MKTKYILVLLSVLVFFSCVPLFSSAADKEYSIMFNGQGSHEEKALQRHHNWYIPVEALSQAYGLELTERNDGDTRTLPVGMMGYRVEYPVYYSDQVMVLMYHHITPEPTRTWVITPKQFEEHLQAILRSGFVFITMDQYEGYMLHDKPVPDNAVLLTFDDGYQSFYTDVFPILKKYGIEGTNFVIVGTIENDSKDNVKKLTWDQMREMKKQGMNFYNHTYYSHLYAPTDKEGKHQRPILFRPIYSKKLGRVETRSEYLARVRNDLQKAEERLKTELGNTKSIIAFPYGSFNKDVLQICKDLGIEISFTVKPGINDRLQRNGFRVNGGDQKISADDLVRQLINRGEKTDRYHVYIPRRAVWDGRKLEFDPPPIQIGDKWYITMKEAQELLDIQFDVSHKNQSVNLISGDALSIHGVKY